MWQRRLWTTLHGKTAVIAGSGIVGSAIGEMLQALGMYVIGVSRTVRKARGFDEIFASDRLREATARSDYLINILPATPENTALFDAGLFAAMKSSAYYISAGRGQTVDEAALIAALRERRIAGAAFDVFQTEPLPPESPLWTMPNVFITPHMSAHTDKLFDRCVDVFCENLRRYLDSKPLLNQVHPAQ